MSDRKTLQLPALDPAGVPLAERFSYPEPFFSRMGKVDSRALGDACGLNELGVNLVVLEPGAQSALRHWHSLEDEFVYVLDGEVVLVTEAGEQIVTAGGCAGFPAGQRDGHHLINRSAEPVRILEIGNRTPGDDCFYPDDDMLWFYTEDGWHAAHKDGRPYDPSPGESSQVDPPG